MSDFINVAVCYALPQRQDLVELKLPAGSTASQAIAASGLQQKHPDIDLDRFKVGVFGKLIKLDTPLQDQDRVEIYRPLIADPKEVRRKRTEEGKAMKKGGGDLPPAA
ncbi:RnfH family protein [Uliginosibacterium gangwonense]|uniref:RnfH family protein n=1 Tax=Uliginosibacterium gangwonense TaxID=392736 RepID=UPI0003696C8C|nr:RnfH family protein [Uliginosibacterium gangwonense]